MSISVFSGDGIKELSHAFFRLTEEKSSDIVIDDMNEDGFDLENEDLDFNPELGSGQK